MLNENDKPAESKEEEEKEYLKYVEVVFSSN